MGEIRRLVGVVWCRETVGVEGFRSCRLSLIGSGSLRGNVFAQSDLED